MPKTIRLAVPLAALLLASTAMAVPAQAGWFDFGGGKSDDTNSKDSTPASKDAKDKIQPAVTLDSSINEAHLLRLAGRYPEAIKHLSQLMMVAADDPRVVSEYGKTLASMGRAQDAVNFLTRAQQLSPGDWTVFSAIGVAYDQTGDSRAAAAAYERALALKPDEPSVLTNYALSRMLAKDPDSAKKLIARVESTGGASDPKIASNIAMIRKMAPADAPVAVAATAPRPAAAPSPAPTTHVAQVPLPVMTPAPQGHVAQNTPTAAPRPLVQANNNAVIDVAPQMAMPAQAAPRGVVMQAVPIDPLAGPVVKLHPPAPKAVAKAEPKPAPKPVQTAATQAEDLQAKADAIARQIANKPAAIAQVKAEASKPSASVATGAPKVLQPAKADAPKVLAPVAAKTADAKPAKDAKAIPVKTASKDAVPALRVSSSAY